MQVHAGSMAHEGELPVHASSGSGITTPYAVIEFSRAFNVSVQSAADCDRVIRAARRAKGMLEKIGTPHEFTPMAGNSGHCDVCGDLDDEDHWRPEAPGMCAELHPRGNYSCELPPGHDGDHDVPSCDDGSGGMAWPQAGPAAGDEPVITAPADPGWRDPATGLMSGLPYDHPNRLSCGCTFTGPLTWPAGRRAHCDSHGDVETVPGPDDPEHRPLLAVAPETEDAR